MTEARLSCIDVTVRFGGIVALSDVVLEVPGAKVVGLVGPNGAGKSTLFAVLSGLLRPTHGRVLMDGDDVTHSTPQTRAERGLARTFQHPELFTGLSVRDHLVLAYRVRHARRRVWGDMFTLGSLRRGDPAERQAVDGLLELLGLGPIADRQTLGLPLGMGRLVEVGRALASDPKETDHFEAALRRVTGERGISVLIVEHDVELVMRVSSYIYVLDFGVLIASGPPDQVWVDPAVRAAYLGEEVGVEPAGDEGTVSA